MQQWIVLSKDKLFVFVPLKWNSSALKTKQKKKMMVFSSCKSVNYHCEC
jgi:hypothetical protein